MNRYTSYCTEEQTRRAYRLGAPIIEQNFDAMMNSKHQVQIGPEWHYIPTTQQMIGWLEQEKGLFPIITIADTTRETYEVYICGDLDNRQIVIGRNNAELTAIDTALDYLEKKTE